MKIQKIVRKKENRRVNDCYVGDGYVKRYHGSLPDIDSDFNASRRDEVKAYLERRYNKDGMQRVFSAGTFTTIKIKSAIKDVARTFKISPGTVNYLTSILDDNMSWTDLMRLAVTDKRIGDFVQKYPQVFEEILPIMGQARSAGIHASALIITPEYVKGEKVECFDLLPIRKMGDLLVSEISGNDIDAIGILKNDILGIKELTRLSDVINLIAQEYGVRYTILEIASKYLNDRKVFKLIREGFTQGVFQMSGDGITKFIRRLAPDDINDIIASVALFRPGPLESGAAENYVQAKRGEYQPEYLWGTYEILKDTFGQLIYQEQISMVAQKIGSLSLGDGVNLVKALSKKKLEKVRKFKDKYFIGAEQNGCPIEDANKIWSDVEDAAKYSFNKSHATAYGLTSYVGAWLKTYYPTAFYTVVLKDQDEERMPILLNEIANVGGTELLSPDINISSDNFTADFKNNRIYWSLGRIKQLGVKGVEHIVEERALYGQFDDLEDFIRRIFKNKFKSKKDDGGGGRTPVTSRSVKNLIYAGAFDRVENVSLITDRYQVLKKAAELLEFALEEDDEAFEDRDSLYYWSSKQIEVSGFGAIDYRAIFDSIGKPSSLAQRYLELRELNNVYFDEKRGVVCATISEVTDKTFKDRKTGETRHFGKIVLRQNTETNILTIWDDWSIWKKELKSAVGKIIAASVNIKWSDYDEKYTMMINKSSFLKIV